MADAGASFWVPLLISAGGTAITTADNISANKAREKQLERELQANELAALDQENRRLIELREANDQILANAGGIEAYASASLVAARAFNFTMAMEDIANIGVNLAASRSGISTRIGILQSNSRASRAGGIFEMAGIFGDGLDKAGLLEGPGAPETKTTAITKKRTTKVQRDGIGPPT